MQRPNYTQFLGQKGHPKYSEPPDLCPPSHSRALAYAESFSIFATQACLCSLKNRCKCEVGLLASPSVFLPWKKINCLDKAKSPGRPTLGTINSSSGQENSKYLLLTPPSWLHVRFFLSVHPTPLPDQLNQNLW